MGDNAYTILSHNIDTIMNSVSSKNTMFLANISHEMRTPLNGIIGIIDLMAHDGDMTKNAEVYLKTLQQSCRTLLSVVNRLQDISSLQTDAGNSYLSFDLEAVVTGISQAMQYYNIATEESTQLRISYDTRAPRIVKGDLTKIQQILTNICTVAALISEEKYVKMDIVLKHSDKEKCVLGVLIQSGYISEVENFEVGEKSILHITASDMFDTRTINNMLITMNISRKFLQELDSVLHINRDKHALSFHFNINVISQEPLPRRDTSDDAIKLLTDAKILVVDDNKVNVMVVTKMLKVLGIKSSSAKDGQEAINKLKTEDFHLIFMDLDMPNLDGYEATKHIRNVLHSDVCIIALTANSSNSAKSKCKDVGMNDFFTKPVTIHTLSEMIRKWYIPR